MLNWALRYQPILELLRELQAAPADILEVGSGSHGLAHYLQDGPVVGVDVEFSEPLHPLLVGVKASADRLPFPSGSFALVVASDVLEHLPPGVRAAVLQEMLRVSRRYLILAFPSGEVAKEADMKLARDLRRRGVPLPSWLCEHFSFPYPTPSEVAALVGNVASISQTKSNTNVRLHRLVLLAEHLPVWNRVVAFCDRPRALSLLGPVLHLAPAYRELVLVRKELSPKEGS